MLSKMPSYYRSSKVMKELINSLELETERLKSATSLTENQFFVILADKNLKDHEKDVGLLPDLQIDLNTRKSRVLSRLRGTGTVTKKMIQNVAASFVNGNIEITEYPSEYYFEVKFTSRTGIPYNLEDIKAMIEQIKPAHLEVKYIFTYRLWEDVHSLSGWNEVKTYTWQGLLTFATLYNINIINEKPYYCAGGKGNATVVWIDNKAYARRNE